MSEKIRKINIPIFVSHSGCPHQCSFCNQKTITGNSATLTAQEVRDKIEDALSTAGQARAEAAFFGGSFTAIAPEKQEELLSAVAPYLRDGRLDGIRLSTRPDCVDETVVERLVHYGVTSVELGVQSGDAYVLEQNRRGHTFEDVKKAVVLLRAAGFEVGLQMMLGLYASTPEKDIQTARAIADLRPDTTRIYPTLVLEGSPLADLYLQGKYVPYDLETAVETAATVYEIFKENGVRVLRMGLMDSESLKSGTLAGPMHPAFGELVFSRMYYRKMRQALAGRHGGTFTFYVHPGEVSKALGNKKENQVRLFREQGVNIQVKPHETVESGEIIW